MRDENPRKKGAEQTFFKLPPPPPRQQFQPLHLRHPMRE